MKFFDKYEGGLDRINLWELLDVLINFKSPKQITLGVLNRLTVVGGDVGSKVQRVLETWENEQSVHLTSLIVGLQQEIHHEFCFELDMAEPKNYKLVNQISEMATSDIAYNIFNTYISIRIKVLDSLMDGDFKAMVKNEKNNN